MDDKLCFCGSGKPHENCHSHINNKSMVARLYEFQQELDCEIIRQVTEKDLPVKCKPACSECCSQCFLVSESEFVQIMDYMINNWTKDEILSVINTAKKQWEVLISQFPSIAEKLNGPIPLNEVFQLDNIRLPFECVFLNGDNCCSIYGVRPISCRICGTSYSNLCYDFKPCSVQPATLSNISRLVNLMPYLKKLHSFVFLKYENKIYIKRPSPLFYLFNLIFKDLDIDDAAQLEFYKDILSLEEEEYIKGLIKAD